VSGVRLPAQHSNQSARRLGRPYGDEASAVLADKSADRAETDQPAAAHRHGNIAAAGAPASVLSYFPDRM